MRFITIYLFSLILMNSLSGQEISLYEQALNYEPKSIRVSIDLHGVDADMDLEKNLEAAYIITLKQSLYHMKCCNQTYNLLTIFDAEAEYILDTVLNDMGLDKAMYELDGLSSLRPYDFIRGGKSEMDSEEINRLISLIEDERERIKKLYGG